MIHRLKPCDRWAVDRLCRITRVWGFPLLDDGETAVRAKAKRKEKLGENIATSSLFGSTAQYSVDFVAHERVKRAEPADFSFGAPPYNVDHGAPA
jgi:hypothetical protein